MNTAAAAAYFRTRLTQTDLFATRVFHHPQTGLLLGMADAYGRWYPAAGIGRVWWTRTERIEYRTSAASAAADAAQRPTAR